MAENDSKIRVLIVDDHQVVRQGLRTFLELQPQIEVVGEAADGSAAVDLVRHLAPDIVLMDLVMPGCDGVSATRQIGQLGLQTRVIVLTSFVEDDKVFSAIQAGAASYLLKDVTPEELRAANQAFHRREPRLHPDVARKLMAHISGAGAASSPPTPETLTERGLGGIPLFAESPTKPP